MSTAQRPNKNLLCYGDNLAFLKNTDLLPDESIDLIYLDPPFNSSRSYNRSRYGAAPWPESRRAGRSARTKRTATRPRPG